MGDGSDGDGGGVNYYSVNAHFQRLKVEYRLGQEVPWADTPSSRLRIQTDQPTGIDILTKLADIITGGIRHARIEDNLLYVEIGEFCRWFHESQSEPTPLEQMVVHVPHPTDSTSIMILRNTEAGLHVTLQGAWLSDASKINELDAAWLSANWQRRPVRISPGMTIRDDEPCL